MGISNLFAIKVFKLQRSEVIGVIVPPLLEVLRGLDRRKSPRLGGKEVVSDFAVFTESLAWP